MAAVADAVGRTCPYCRSTLAELDEVTACPACNATHHADCWAENGGCAVLLCEAGPKEEADAQEPPAAPAQAEAPTEVVPPGPPPPPVPPTPLPTVTAPPARPPSAGKAAPPPPEGRRHPRGIGLLPVLAGIIILLGGGTAAAIILTKSHDSTPGAAPVEAEPASSEASSDSEAGAESFEQEPTAETEPVDVASPPELVERALQAHFGRLVADNYTAAYADLTPSEGESIGGEEGWIAAQQEDELEHFELTVDASMHGPHAATAEIIYFATHAYASGCHTWSGSWEMVKQYGSWLIAGADLERGAC